MSDLQPVKSFWQRREGTAGKITLALIAVAITGAVLSYWTVLLALIANVIYFYCLVGAAVVLAVALSNSEFRKRCTFFFMGSMQYLFAINPLVTIKGYIAIGYKRLATMNERIIDVRKQSRNLQQVMDLNSREAQNEVALARQCSQGSNEFNLHVANAGRLKKSNDDIKVVWTQLDTAYRVLLAMKERAEIEIKNFENTVSVQERQLKALKSGTSAYRNAIAVIQGDPQEKYVLDQAMENLADQIGERIGEMDHFMDISATILRSAQLQGAVDREEGLKMLEEWSKSPSLLLGSEKTVLLSASANSTPDSVIPVEPIRAKKNWNSLIENH